MSSPVTNPTPETPGVHSNQGNKKKMGCGKIVLIALGALLGLGILITIASGGDDKKESTNTPAPASSGQPQPADKEDKPSNEAASEAPEEKPQEEDVPREHKNALRAAERYIDTMAFSYQGLYDQLTSEYGSQYPAEAAQYALDNLDVDWNAEALEAAQNYQDIMPMSDDGLIDQLTSEYGEQFTLEQAQYAVANL